MCMFVAFFYQFSMNYIELINDFWRLSDEQILCMKSSEISTYFALLRVNNELGWRESFRPDWQTISQYAGISKNTFYKCIESLKNRGFIDYKKGIRNTLKPEISILGIKNKSKNKTVNKKAVHVLKSKNKSENKSKNKTVNLNKQVNNKLINNKTITSDCEKSRDEGSSSTHKDFIKKFDEFYKEQTGAKFSWTNNGKELAAIKQIRLQCENISQENEGESIDIFSYILTNWDLQKNGRYVLDDFIRKGITPSMVNMNFSSILKLFRDAKHNNDNGKNNKGPRSIAEQVNDYVDDFKRAGLLGSQP